MDAAEITTKVISIIAAVKHVEPSSIQPDSTLEQLKIDSLDKINILFELEGAFDIEIPDDEARAVTNVSDIVERIARRLNLRTADAS